MARNNCNECKGSGSFLVMEGRGYYRDGSFGHNQYRDCDKCAGTGRDIGNNTNESVIITPAIDQQSIAR